MRDLLKLALSEEVFSVRISCLVALSSGLVYFSFLINVNVRSLQPFIE
ncbi:hypothetical protein A2U01_0054461, partial [Trifolium medium]|nr:hypothetical protein [Trifolium medium]